jgi:hypothetical protein
LSIVLAIATPGGTDFQSLPATNIQRFRAVAAKLLNYNKSFNEHDEKFQRELCIYLMAGLYSTLKLR